MRMFLAILVLVSLCGSAPGDVFNMPPGQTSLSFVPVGNPGNPSDPTNVYHPGSVGYAYNIGKYEVTIGQYAEFLNAVAATDTYSLYHTAMASYSSTAGIARSGSPGNYNYSAIGSANRPISFVSWGDSARFANWLTNGQPSGSQNPATTEDGSYFLNGATTEAAILALTRKPSARYVIPTEDEWYKAAYYDPTPGAGGGDAYWLYPMQTDSLPYSDQPPGLDAPNAALAGNFWRDDEIANGFDDGFALSGSPDWISSQNYLTDVGAYNIATNYYGTFDQGGNVQEWNETIPFNSQRGILGSSWDQGELAMRSTSRSGLTPTGEIFNVGFRIVEVPEPGSLGTLSIGALILLRKRRRPWC